MSILMKRLLEENGTGNNHNNKRRVIFVLYTSFNEILLCFYLVI